MSDRLNFIRLPLLLLVIFFLGKLIVGALGGSYELGIRLFAMVPLTVHLCLVWGAISRAYKGQGATAALLTGLLIALGAQLLIVIGTAGSYLAGADTHLSNPIAIVNEARPVAFGEAMLARLVGLIINSIIGAVASLIGWALGGLIPSGQAEAS